MKKQLIGILAVVCLVLGACTKATKDDNRLTREFGIWNVLSVQTTAIDLDGNENLVSEAVFDEAYWRFFLGPSRIHICEIYSELDGEASVSLPVFAHDDHRLTLYDGQTELNYTIEEFTRSSLVLSRYRYDANVDPNAMLQVTVRLEFCGDCPLRELPEGLEETGI